MMGSKMSLRNHLSIFILLTLSGGAFAAKKIPAIPEMFIINGSPTADNIVMVNDQRLQFDVIEMRVRADGSVLKHYRQKYQDIPVWGEKVTSQLRSNQSVPNISGQVIVDINRDLQSVTPVISIKEAFSIAITHFSHSLNGVSEASHVLGRFYTDNVSQGELLWIYLDQNEKACLVYLIRGARHEKMPRPFILVDAVTGNILQQGKDQAPLDAGHLVGNST